MYYDYKFVYKKIRINDQCCNNITSRVRASCLTKYILHHIIRTYVCVCVAAAVRVIHVIYLYIIYIYIYTHVSFYFILYFTSQQDNIVYGKLKRSTAFFTPYSYYSLNHWTSWLVHYHSIHIHIVVCLYGCMHITYERSKESLKNTTAL